MKTEIKLESLTILKLKPDDILVFKIETPCNEKCSYIIDSLEEKGIENRVMFLSVNESVSVVREIND